MPNSKSDVEIKFSDLESSIIIICTLEAAMQEYLGVLKREKNDLNSVVFAAVRSQLLLTACSFREEWDLLGSLAKVNKKVRLAPVN